MTLPSDNPLLEPWDDSGDGLGLPPFDRIRPEHFRPAFDATMAAQMRAVEAIAQSPEPPTFANTIVALEVSGFDLERVAAVFFHLASADTNEALQAVEREIAPLLSRHGNAIYLNAALFARIDALWQNARRRSASTTSSARCSTATTPSSCAPARRSTRPARRGLPKSASGWRRSAPSSARTCWPPRTASIWCSARTISTACRNRCARRRRKRRASAILPGKYVITLSRSSIEPFLQFSTRRDLREKAFQAWVTRGEKENAALIAETIRLRNERARLMGYETFAHFKLADSMAKTPEAVSELLNAVWEPALRRVGREEQALQAMIAAEGDNFRLAPWDWRHYAERRRKAEFDFDEAELEPYLQARQCHRRRLRCGAAGCSASPSRS